MAIDIYAWEILSNHLHALVETRPDLVRGWTDRDVAIRYLTLCPCKWRRRRKGIPVDAPPTDEEIDDVLTVPGRIAVLRERLSSVSWFMAMLKEPIARWANKEDDCTGHFWEGRFQCVAVLDEAAIVAVATYIDLNAIRAGLVERIEAAHQGSVSERARLVAGRRPRTSIPLKSIPGFTDRAYLKHVDEWSRVVVPGKRSVPRVLPPILERLGLTRQSWASLIKRGLETVSGTAIGSAEALRDEARRRMGHWVLSPTRNWTG
jgi:hypothetical protein